MAANTLAAYRRDLGRYLAFTTALGVTAPRRVGPEHVAAFLAAIRTGEDGGLVRLRGKGNKERP